MRRLPSASALDRAFNCQASEVYPHSQSTSEYAALGTAVHAFIEAARKVGRDVALEAVDADAPHRQFCEALPLDQLPAGGDHEVKLAWDYERDTARILPGEGKRDYFPATATEFVGTADYVGRNGVAVVGDWKTGFRLLGPARESRQLRFGALAAARLTGIDDAKVFYATLREDGSVFFSWATFDAFDLAEIADEMRQLATTLRALHTVKANLDAAVQPHEGPWCDYCPAFNACPAKMRLARAIGGGTALASIPESIEAMTDSELATAYAAIERYDDVAERVRKAIRQRAAMQPVDLGDGRVLGSVDWPWTVVNATVAYEVIEASGGKELADQVVPRSATLTAIKKLGKPVLEAIEQRGGIITGKKPQVRVHRKKETAA